MQDTLNVLTSDASLTCGKCRDWCMSICAFFLCGGQSELAMCAVVVGVVWLLGCCDRLKLGDRSGLRQVKSVLSRGTAHVIIHMDIGQGRPL